MEIRISLEPLHNACLCMLQLLSERNMRHCAFTVFGKSLVRMFVSISGDSAVVIETKPLHMPQRQNMCASPGVILGAPGQSLLQSFSIVFFVYFKCNFLRMKRKRWEKFCIRLFTNIFLCRNMSDCCKFLNLIKQSKHKLRSEYKTQLQSDKYSQISIQDT